MPINQNADKFPGDSWFGIWYITFEWGNPKNYINVDKSLDILEIKKKDKSYEADYTLVNAKGETIKCDYSIDEIDGHELKGQGQKEM